MVLLTNYASEVFPFVQYSVQWTQSLCILGNSNVKRLYDRRKGSTRPTARFLYINLGAKWICRTSHGSKGFAQGVSFQTRW
jgi:hypothetical protein